MIRAYVLAQLFSLVGATQATFSPVDSSASSIPLSMVFMTVAPQGGGKSRVTHGVNAVFKRARNAYYKLIEQKVLVYNQNVEGIARATYGEASEKAIQRIEAYKKEHCLKPFALEFTQLGTSQGIAHSIDTMRRLGVGGYTHIIDECADEIVSKNQEKQDFISTLLDFSGGKKSISRPLKGEFFQLNAEGIAFNLHFMGNKEALLESEKTFKQFRAFLRKGFARRTLFTYIPKRKIVERHVFDMIPELEKTEKASAYFENVFTRFATSEGKQFIFDVEAIRLFRDYAYHNQFESDNKDADNERNDHVFKAQKLACILAFIDGVFYVSKAHAESAMAYVQESAKHYAELIASVEDEALEESSSYETQILHLLKQSKTPYRVRDLKLDLRPRNKVPKGDAWNALLFEAMQMAEEDGFYLVHEEGDNTKGRRGYVCYLKPMDATPEAVVTYSVKPPDDPERPKHCNARGYEVVTSTLEELTLYSSSCHVSPAIFKDGHRKTENVEYMGNLAFFDVDNDKATPETMFTVSDAKSRLSGYQGVIINTSSSTEAHPKFRIVVVLDKPVKNVSSEAYKRILTNIAKHLGIDAVVDKACIEKARYYAQQNGEAGQGITYANLYGHALEWERFMDDTATVARPVVFTKADVSIGLDEQRRRCVKAINTFCQVAYHDGNRNNTLFRCVRWLRDKGFIESEAEQIMRQVTSSSPLDEREFALTFRSAWK